VEFLYLGGKRKQKVRKAFCIRLLLPLSAFTFCFRFPLPLSASAFRYPFFHFPLSDFHFLLSTYAKWKAGKHKQESISRKRKRKAEAEGVSRKRKWKAYAESFLLPLTSSTFSFHFPLSDFHFPLLFSTYAKRKAGKHKQESISRKRKRKA
jgi:hypothetical protein